MAQRSDFENGREHYLRKEYEQAVKCFMHGAAQGSCACLGWLGQCYEYGLGVGKDHERAKDCYHAGYWHQSLSERKDSFGQWLEERLKALDSIPLPESETRFMNGLGNIRVKRSKYSFIPTQVRHNKNETVIEIENSDSLLSGFRYAEVNLPQSFDEWSCDGRNKFHDGYTLATDFFTLRIHQVPISDYRSVIDDRNLTVLVPETVSFQFLYVQMHILKKVRELLFKRAETVIPLKLKEVADRIGTSFKKCEIVMTNRSWLARNCHHGSKIQFCAKSIQLPQKSLEALCIHELTHNYVLGHGPAFHKKMIELGGEEAHKLDQNLFKEGKWPYLKF